LEIARDRAKDQSYFLWTLKQPQLKYCLFPLGDLTKPEVRKIAQKAGLPNALRADSQGLCFVGKVSLKDFLKPHIQEKQGDIILVGFSVKGIKRGGREESVIGKHQGVHLFTFGQRHGISVGGKEPYFVCDKNVRKNILYVARRKDLPRFFPAQISLRNFSLINSTGVKFPLMCSVRYRYRQPLHKVTIRKDSKGRVLVVFAKPAIAITPGQSIVFYKGKQMLGGGIIKQIPRANYARDKGRL
jgi:tRNA-specific 2-thiouridylase